MSKLKTAITLLLCLFMSFSAFACGGGNTDGSGNGNGDGVSGGGNGGSGGGSNVQNTFTFTGDPIGAKMDFDNGQADGDLFDYNSDLFYYNELRTTCADPHAIYISLKDITESYESFQQSYQYMDENGEFQWINGWSEARFNEEHGTLEAWQKAHGGKYYMTHTSARSLTSATAAKYNCTAAVFEIFSSEDMSNWSLVGAVDGAAIASNKPDEWWDASNWAPEFFRDPESGLFFINFSMVSKSGGMGDKYAPRFSNTDATSHIISCAISTNPLGPYYMATTEEYYTYRAAKDADGKVIRGDTLYEGPDLNRDGVSDYSYYEIYSRDMSKVIGYTDASCSIFYTPSPEGKTNEGYEVLSREPVYSVGYYYPRLCDNKEKVAEFERNLHVTTYAEYATSAHDICVYSGIDQHMFVDHNGDLYMYYSMTNSNLNNKYSFNGSIWGVKMIDVMTPDWDTLTPLTRPGISTIEQSDTNPFGINGPRGENEGGVNEGPEVLYHNGKYYLTYSPWGYTSDKYAIQLAVSDSPLGEYMKMDDYTPVLGMGDQYNDYMTGTGHHCFIQVENELFTLYHAQKNALNNYDNNGNYMGRVLACDRIFFKYIPELGYDIMFSNGPTSNLQPKPEVYTGYTDVSNSATITGNGNFGDISYLTDGMFTAHPISRSYEYGLEGGGELIISLKWENPVEVCAFLAYNAGDFDNAFKSIKCVQFKLAEKPAWYNLDRYNGYVYIENVNIDTRDVLAPQTTMRKGGAAVAEFAPIKITEMHLCISADVENNVGEIYNVARLSELYVFGKEVK